MKLKGRRGTILLHVMVTSVVVAIIAATLLRMTLLSVTASSRAAKIETEKRLDQEAMASLVAYWNSVNMTCANPPNSNYSCNPGATNPPGPPGICGCTCKPKVPGNPPLPTVTTNGTPGNCTLTIASTDLP